MDPSSRESLSDAEMKLSTHREEVETVIDSLAVEGSIRFTQMPDSDKGLLWIFKYGTIRVYVAITGETDDDTLTVWAPVLKMPATPEKESDLYRFLLERNWLETWESRFCIRSDEVVLLSMRTLDSIDPGEISRAITIVATLADEYDESLLEQFGGQAP